MITFLSHMHVSVLIVVHIGKHRALSCKVTCNFKLYLEIGRTSVKPNLKHRILM